MVSVLGPLDDAIAEQMKADVLAVCQVLPPHQAKGFTVRPEMLSGEAQLRFDDGELPQEWKDWWASQAVSLQARDGAALITLEPGLLGQRRVQPLSLEALMALMETSAWTRPAGVVIAWGVDDGLIGRTVLRRIVCAGALSVHVDGCAAVLVAEPNTVQDWCTS